MSIEHRSNQHSQQPDPYGTQKVSTAPDPYGTQKVNTAPDPYGTQKVNTAPDPYGTQKVNTAPDPHGTQKSDVAYNPYGTQKTGAGYTFNPNGTQPVRTKRTPSPTPHTSSDSSYTDPGRQRSSLKKIFLWIGISVIVISLALLIGYLTIHSWTTASCTEASICTICGKQKQAATGHNWVEATCTQSKFCSFCYTESGLPLGHQWTEATCSAPSQCTRCNEISGVALPHVWLSATYAMPQTCEVCGTTTGEPTPIPNISLAQEIANSSDVYYETMALYEEDELYRRSVTDGARYYYDEDNNLRMIVNAKGNQGISEYSDQYRRYYYFDNDTLVFAIFEGEDIHRLYFCDGYLMRWRYQAPGQARSDAVNEDFTASEGFLRWESLALSEADMLLRYAYDF